MKFKKKSGFLNLKVWGNLNEILSDQHIFYYETFPLTENLKL